MSASNDKSYNSIGCICNIPVRNLWLFMLYASELFKEIEQSKISIEDNPDDIPDLIAEILCRRVERRIARNLNYGYKLCKSNLDRVRGHIDLLKTERYSLLDRGKIACKFYDLTIDTIRNRYVLAALEKMSRLVIRKQLAHRCRCLASCLKKMGVHGEKPSRSEVSLDHLGRHDLEDQSMVMAAHLAFNLALPTEISGTKQLSLPDRNIYWVRKLYERGIAGFYNVVLPRNKWRVCSSKILYWQIIKKSENIDSFFPLMKADIMIDNLNDKHRIVIDTKFNSLIVSGWHRDNTLRSGYIYQIFTYLRSQEGNGDLLSEDSTGILLHPSVGEMIDEYVVIQNHTIRFLTIDLSASAHSIRNQLLNVVK